MLINKVIDDLQELKLAAIKNYKATFDDAISLIEYRLPMQTKGMYCGRCDSKLPEYGSYCNYCGQRIDREDGEIVR